jgi:outer membrane protein assembly factor BamA
MKKRMIESYRRLEPTATTVRWAASLALVITASVCLADVASAVTVERRVVVVGNRVFKAGEILEIARQGGWKPGRGSVGLSALQEAYFREGYLQASFQVIPGQMASTTASLSYAADDSVVVLVVDEGSVARLGRVHVKGAQRQTSGAIRETLGIEESAEFVPRVFDRRVGDLLRSYDEQGHPFAQVWIDSLSLDEGNVVHLSLFVVEGRERKLENVAVEGAQKTKPELVVRMSGLQPGRVYRGEMLRDAYLRLVSSGVFTDVEQPKLRVSPDGAGVDAVLVVDEARRSNSFAAVLGYAAAENGRDDQLSGLVRLGLNNIGGTLKDLHALWTNDGRGRSETRLQYRDRYFLGRLMMVSLLLEQVGQDTLYSWQSVGLEAGRSAGRIGRNLVGVSAGVHADRNVFSEGTLLRSWRYRIATGVSLIRGNLQRRTFADINTRFTLARKNSYFREEGGAESLNQYILEFEGDGSVGLMRSLALYLGLAYRGLESGEELIPLSEQFYIGGARTLRGYRENQFHGRRVATARSELRVGNSAQENLYLFVDTGYVLQETPVLDGIVSQELFRTGYGFGLRTSSQIGVIGLSFGIGEEVSLGQAKVHILLEQQF